ncbi:hypothetical protein ACFV7Q_26855 [Streptomyces sp. NPDC059851]|uniref:hypothetical protein n=1 Tax=Streptomyces sp. NPDC059851 TaxID=3346971 RepID=UPI00364AE2BD
MFGLDGRFSSYVAFLYGFSAADQYGDLARYRHWLAEQLALDGSIGWPGIVLRAAFPHDSKRWDFYAERSTEEERIAIATLIRTLEEFMEQTP